MTAEQICNLAVSRCGNKASVENIDTPNSPLEKICAKWWLPSLELALAEMKPNFATVRRTLSINTESPSFGYESQYTYPADCISFLGIGDIRDKENNYTVEGGFIRTDSADGGSLEARMVILETDTSKFTPEFIEELSWYLASNINMEITGDTNKQQYLDIRLERRRPQLAGLNSQENMPSKICTSKFKRSRISGFPQRSYKK